MASSYTSNLGVEKPGSGDQSGTWGVTTNRNFDIFDRAISGVGDITLSGTAHTLTTTDGALSDGGFRVLVLGGSPSGTNTITISPNDQDKLYLVKNGSGQTVNFSQGSGANATLVNGEIAWIFADGAGSGAAVEKATFRVQTTDIVDVTATAAELNFNDTGDSAGVVVASKTVTVDGNKDVASFRNITLTGELDAGSLDVSGDADIDGTLEADAMTLDGVAITTTATLSTGISNNNVLQCNANVADDDFLRIDGTSVEGRSAAEVLSDIGAITASSSDTLTNKSLTAPTLTGSSSEAGKVVFKEDTDNGTNGVTLQGPASTADVTVTLPSSAGTLALTSDIVSGIPSGSVLLFQQTAAPTGFTKITTHNDKALRVVSGSAGTGGSVAFETAFASHTPSGSVSTSVSGTVGGTALTTAQLPAHTHGAGSYTARTSASTQAFSGPFAQAKANAAVDGNTTPVLGTSGSTGSGSTHTHSFSGSASSSFSGSAIDLDVQFVDIILASKD